MSTSSDDIFGDKGVLRDFLRSVIKGQILILRLFKGVRELKGDFRDFWNCASFEDFYHVAFCFQRLFRFSLPNFYPNALFHDMHKLFPIRLTFWISIKVVVFKMMVRLLKLKVGPIFKIDVIFLVLRPQFLRSKQTFKLFPLTLLKIKTFIFIAFT